MRTPSRRSSSGCGRPSSSTRPTGRTGRSRGRSPSTAPRTWPRAAAAGGRAARAPLDRRRLRRPQGRAVRRGRSARSPVTEYGRAKAEAERRVAAACPGALLVRTSLILGGPGHEPSKHEARRATRRRRSTRTRSAARCRSATSPRLCSSLRRSTCPGRCTSRARMPSRAPSLAELVAGRPVRRGPAPAGRPLDCSLDSSRAPRCSDAPLRGVRELFAEDGLPISPSDRLQRSHDLHPRPRYGLAHLLREDRRRGRRLGRLRRRRETSLRATPSMSSSYTRSGSSMSLRLPLAQRVHGDALRERRAEQRAGALRQDDVTAAPDRAAAVRRARRRARGSPSSPSAGSPVCRPIRTRTSRRRASRGRRAPAARRPPLRPRPGPARRRRRTRRPACRSRCRRARRSARARAAGARGQHVAVPVAEPLEERVEPSMSLKTNVTVPEGTRDARTTRRALRSLSIGSDRPVAPA